MTSKLDDALAKVAADDLKAKGLPNIPAASMSDIVRHAKSSVEHAGGWVISEATSNMPRSHMLVMLPWSMIISEEADDRILASYRKVSWPPNKRAVLIEDCQTVEEAKMKLIAATSQPSHA